VSSNSKRMTDELMSIATFSHAVGSIYDCALDPTRWPEAIREVCAMANCLAGVIGVNDLASGAARLQQFWNYEQDWLDRMVIYGPEIAGWLRNVPDLYLRPLDEPMVVKRAVGRDLVERSRYYNEWLQPKKIIDAVHLTVLRQGDSVGVLALSRHESNGAVTDRDLAIIRLLSPHIRRAIAVSDVLDMHAMAVNTFEASLDLIAAGVVLVDAHGTIIHANRAARSMLAAGSPIRSDQGALHACLPEATAALRAVIAKAAGDEAAVGGGGIGIPAPHSNGDPALIHVLPLMSGDIRTRIAPRASAALFITPAVDGIGDSGAALGALFDLSPGEVRPIERLIAGDTVAEAAKRLDIAVATVRTHLRHIFEKTGTSRQAELVGLAAKFLPQVGRSSGSGTRA
jgi:DNA-binding CsgD family transcriptional regulator/PAS domain-containing protein